MVKHIFVLIYNPTTHFEKTLKLIAEHVRNFKPKQKCTVNQIRDLS